jgi:transposase
MPKAYSADMRERVIAEVEGGASRREAAEEVEVSASTAIIWVKCFRETGRCAAKPRGGSVSPLEEYADFLLGLIKKERLFKRRKITFKKKPARGGAGAHGCGAGAATLDARTGHV